MVLCPFVYILTCRSIPPLQLEPSEVAAVHWVSIRALLSSSLRTYESCDISDRLTRQGDWLIRAILRLSCGKMLYPATHLVPTESLFCSTIPGFIPEEGSPSRSYTNLYRMALKCLCPKNVKPVRAERPLLLWGLTYGIVNDFLGHFPSNKCQPSWTWPTFSHKDIQFFLWLLTYQFKSQRWQALSTNTVQPTIIMGEGSGSEVVASQSSQASPSSFMGKPGEYGITNRMLDGYYNLVKRALFVTFLFRITIFSALAIGFLKRFRGWFKKNFNYTSNN